MAFNPYNITIKTCKPIEKDKIEELHFLHIVFEPIESLNYATYFSKPECRY